MAEKRFVEFLTQNVDDGNLNSGFQDITSGKWYYTKDSENAKKICEILNELHKENEKLIEINGRNLDHMKAISNHANDLAKFNEQLLEENKELKEEIIEWKSKYFEAMDTVINEYSTNIKEDMEELKKEVWGDVE